MLGEEVGWGVNEGSNWLEWNIWFVYISETIEDLGSCPLNYEADRKAWVNRECPIVAGTVSISFTSCSRDGVGSRASFW